MTRGYFIECRLDLRDERRVEYEDDVHLESDKSKPKTFKTDVDDDALRKVTTRWLTELVRTREDSVSGEGLKILGRHLYGMVFNGEVDTAFRSTFQRFVEQASAGRVSGLRLVIKFHADAESLADRPWEFLYLATGDRGEGTFLAGEKHSLVLTRVVPDHPRFPDKPCSSLKVLFVTGFPSESNTESTKNLNALFEQQNALKIVKLTDPTYSMLQTEIKNHRPDVLHFVGHGQPGRLQIRREPERIQADEVEAQVMKSKGDHPAPVPRVEYVEVSKIRELFRPAPRLVFLQTCDSAAADRVVLYSTAVEIVKSGVPAVIAMQYDIGAGEADDFATEFYRHLMRGTTIGQAVWAGRKQLASKESRAWDHRDFGTPVIYVAQDSEIFVAHGGDYLSEDKKPRPKLLTCKRCGSMVTRVFCPECELPPYCPCHRMSSECKCKEELERPERGFCTDCGHRFHVPQYSPDADRSAKPSLKPPVPTATLRTGQDGFEQAS